MRNFGYDVTYVCRSVCLSVCLRASGEESIRAICLGKNRVAALHLATRVFLAGNHNSDEQRDKDQEIQRKVKEHEIRGNKI